MQTLKVDKSWAGNRLDKFLTKKLKFSRSQIQKKIKNTNILVNNKKVAVHYFLKEGDEIVIEKLRNEKLRKNIKTKKINIKIIKETEEYLVINKPAGLLVHSTENNQEKATLVDWILKKYPEIKKVWDKKNKTGKTRPGIVHRLDRDVSGLMVIAKNQKMFNHLKKQFQIRKIRKIYQVLVHGEIKQEQGTIKLPIVRSKKTGLMIAKSTPDSKAKEAITEFEVLQRFKNYTLLKINLKTGRTHQIRVHLKSIGHGVVNDTLYQTRNQKNTYLCQGYGRQEKQKFNLNKIFLCATKLGFNDLKNQWQEFKINLPKELTNILKSVK